MAAFSTIYGGKSTAPASSAYSSGSRKLTAYGGYSGSVNPITTPATTSKSSGTSTTSSAKNTQEQSTLQALETLVSNKTTDTTARETGTIKTDQMDAATREAYNQLLAQLQGGGTAQQKAGSAALSALLQQSQAGANNFSIDAARLQAQQSNALYAQQLREQIMPQINAAMEAAGLSGDSMNALLAQDAASRTAAQAANAEADLIAKYGALAQGQQELGLNVAQQMQADPVVTALNNLLNTGKGAYTTETKDLTTRTQGNESATQTGSRNQAASGTTAESGNTSANNSANSSGTDVAALMNALANQNNAATNAQERSSQSLLQQVQALSALQTMMPSGQNILGGLTVNNSPTRGEQGALTLGRGAGQVVQYSGMNNLLTALGLR